MGGKRPVDARGAAATTLRTKLDAAPDARARQLLLARVTGNDKHGNERRA